MDWKRTRGFFGASTLTFAPPDTIFSSTSSWPAVPSSTPPLIVDACTGPSARSILTPPLFDETSQRPPQLRTLMLPLTQRASTFPLAVSISIPPETVEIFTDPNVLIGTFGSVKISTVSGGIEIDTARGNVDARCVSGSIKVRSCGGRCDVSSKSGGVRIERAEGPVHASTISGGVELGTAGHDEVELKMVSGGAKVKVLAPKNPRVRFQSISGKMHCECAQGSDFDLKVKSISGSLEVTEG